MEEYENFLRRKLKTVQESGFEVSLEELHTKLFPFQKWIVQRALRAGRYAIFGDCGLGKTFMQIEWCEKVFLETGKMALILCPLAVKGQTLLEAEKWGYFHETFMEVWNYDQIHNLDVSKYSGVVLDESSILKNYSGATKKTIVDLFINTPYKLACTATPSPNDPIEIGSHSEFMNQMGGKEMLAMFFFNDAKDKAEKWKLKKHGAKHFYDWISTWAVMLNKPQDIGFDMEGYELPPLVFHETKIETEKKENGLLFNDTAVSATDFNSELRRTKEARMNLAAKIANETKDPVIVWIKQNEEGEYLRKIIPGAIEVKGSDTPEWKESKLLGFARNEFRVLITKTKVAQFGLNYQNCHTQIFASLDFSFEGLYQAIRRSYRFGQEKQVDVYVITTDTMSNVVESIEEKKVKFREMQEQMIESMKRNLEGFGLRNHESKGKREENEYFDIRHCDSIKEIKTLAENSVDISIFSPPFSSLYTYSDSIEDLSNCRNHSEFFEHFDFLVKDLLRITKPGRLACLHVTQLTTMKGDKGFFSIMDFRGDVIRLFEKNGWIFHAETTIWKDPEMAAIRTKATQLMHGTTKRDATDVRPGLADYLLCFRKHGINEKPVNFLGKGLDFDLWCNYASPVWMDINASDTLQYLGGRDDDDVKHITPTQLEVWKRCLTLWSNPGDTVFTPFMGIGSEVWQAVKMGRKGIGFELKESYFDQAKKNLEIILADKKQMELFE